MPYARSRRTGLVRTASRTPDAAVDAFHHAHPRSVPLITTPTGTSMSDLIHTAFAPGGLSLTLTVEAEANEVIVAPVSARAGSKAPPRLRLKCEMSLSVASWNGRNRTPSRPDDQEGEQAEDEYRPDVRPECPPSPADGGREGAELGCVYHWQKCACGREECAHDRSANEGGDREHPCHVPRQHIDGEHQERPQRERNT